MAFRARNVFGTFEKAVPSTDLKKRLDRAIYCFGTQVFKAIGTLLTQFVIDRRNINHISIYTTQVNSAFGAR